MFIKLGGFLRLIFLFGLSLISCTFLQQLPSLKIARRCQFFRTTGQFYRLKFSTILSNFSFNKILAENQRKSIFCLSTKKYYLLL
jgi:cytochrome c biogenesis protein ResB